jgi:predicted O-methyltransferase YrrM
MVPATMQVIRHFCKYFLGIEKAQTQTTMDERNCLQVHCQGARICVEIGVWHGVTTRLLRATIAADGIIYAVDPFHPGRLGFSTHRLIARREVYKTHNGSVRWLRMTGEDGAKWFSTNVKQPVDFIFLDGDHCWDAIKADWSGWNPLVKVGGIVALHDSRSSEKRMINEAGSARYTKAVIALDPRFELLDEVDSLSVFRRIR